MKRRSLFGVLLAALAPAGAIKAAPVPQERLRGQTPHFVHYDDVPWVVSETAPPGYKSWSVNDIVQPAGELGPDFITNKEKNDMLDAYLDGELYLCPEPRLSQLRAVAMRALAR